MAWSKFDVGCCCGGTKICVTICSLQLGDWTIDLYSGSTLIDSVNTGSSNCYTFNYSGTYTVKVYDSQGNLMYSGSKTLNGTQINIALSTGSNYICCGGYLIPTTLTLTDSVSSCSLVYYPNDFYPIWYGGYSTTLLSCSVTTPDNVCVAAAPSYGPVKCCYQLICYSGSSPVFGLQRSWSWVYEQGTLTPIWYQDPTGITPGQPCYTAPPPSCGDPHTDTAGCSANPSATNPFALSCTPVDSTGNYTIDFASGTVYISTP